MRTFSWTDEELSLLGSPRGERIADQWLEAGQAFLAFQHEQFADHAHVPEEEQPLLRRLGGILGTIHMGLRSGRLEACAAAFLELQDVIVQLAGPHWPAAAFPDGEHASTHGLTGGRDGHTNAR